MPTYEYRCQKGHEFEVVQRMSEPPVEKCIHCGARAERLLSAGAGLLFKGSGFYITDYRSDSYKKAAEADKGGGAKSTDKDGGAKSTDKDGGAKSTDKGSGAKSADKGSTKSDSKSSSGSE